MSCVDAALPFHGAFLKCLCTNYEECPYNWRHLFPRDAYCLRLLHTITKQKPATTSSFMDGQVLLLVYNLWHLVEDVAAIQTIDTMRMLV